MNAKVWVKWREYIQGKKKTWNPHFWEAENENVCFGFFLPEMINYLNPAT